MFGFNPHFKNTGVYSFVLLGRCPLLYDIFRF
nr:MAG TPA: hypothetical protein [Caudoviricetes sp.]